MKSKHLSIIAIDFMACLLSLSLVSCTTSAPKSLISSELPSFSEASKLRKLSVDEAIELRKRNKVLFLNLSEDHSVFFPETLKFSPETPLMCIDAYSPGYIVTYCE